MHDYTEPAISELYPEAVAAAEIAMASLALVDPAAAFASNLDGSRFYNPRYRAVYDACFRVHERGGQVDPVTVCDALTKDGVLAAVGGIAAVCKLASTYPTAGLAARYAEIIKEAWVGRELRRVAAEVPSALARGASIQEVSDRLRSFVDQVEDAGTTDCVSLEDAVVAEYNRIDLDLKRLAEGKAPTSGLPSGLGLERVVPGGIPRDRLTLLFGETGTYKTAIKQWMCDAVAAAGYHVLDFTLEDSSELTAQRFISRHTGIPYGRIAAREFFQGEEERVKELEPLAKAVASRTIVVGSVPATIEEAIRLSRYWARRVNLAAVFVDYVQLLEPSSSARDSDAKALLEVCKKAQRAAHRDRLAWVLVSQMNRDHAHRDDKRPRLNDLYGGSAIQHTVKLAIGIYRPVAHDPEPPPDSVWGPMYHNHPDGRVRYANALELWIRKSVSGETGVFQPILVDRPTGRMTVVDQHEM